MEVSWKFIKCFTHQSYFHHIYTGANKWHSLNYLSLAPLVYEGTEFKHWKLTWWKYVKFDYHIRYRVLPFQFNFNPKTTNQTKIWFFTQEWIYTSSCSCSRFWTSICSRRASVISIPLLSKPQYNRQIGSIIFKQMQGTNMIQLTKEKKTKTKTKNPWCKAWTIGNGDQVNLMGIYETKSLFFTVLYFYLGTIFKSDTLNSFSGSIRNQQWISDWLALSLLLMRGKRSFVIITNTNTHKGTSGSNEIVFLQLLKNSF